MKWYPVELHTHTEHSDGDFTPTQLVQAAKARGFAGVALTDHNTKSGTTEFNAAIEKSGLTGVHGIEWTTYWGHMLVLGEYTYTDWRGVTPDMIDEAIKRIHDHCGLVGIAHPFALSNPVNTGYHWEFQIADWQAVDFLEVWSRDNAPCKVQSLRAIELWEQLLNRGCHITATSGRDWHREDTRSYAHTYVGIEDELNEQNVLQAIRDSRICLAAGPLLTMQAQTAQGPIYPGQQTEAGNVTIKLCMDDQTMPHDWDRTAIIPEKIVLVQNGEVIQTLPVCAEQTVTVRTQKGWLRADLIGRYFGREEQRIALTNPIWTA